MISAINELTHACQKTSSGSTGCPSSECQGRSSPARRHGTVERKESFIDKKKLYIPTIARLREHLGVEARRSNLDLTDFQRILRAQPIVPEDPGRRGVIATQVQPVEIGQGTSGVPPTALVVLGTLIGHGLIVVLIARAEAHASIVRQRVPRRGRGQVATEVQGVLRLFTGDKEPFVVHESRLIGEVFHVDVKTVFILIAQGVNLLVAQPEVSGQVAEAAFVRGPGDEEVRLLREVTPTLNDRPSPTIRVHVAQHPERTRTGSRP